MSQSLNLEEQDGLVEKTHLGHSAIDEKAEIYLDQAKREFRVKATRSAQDSHQHGLSGSSSADAESSDLSALSSDVGIGPEIQKHLQR